MFSILINLKIPKIPKSAILTFLPLTSYFCIFTPMDNHFIIEETINHVKTYSPVQKAGTTGGIFIVYGKQRSTLPLQKKLMTWW